MLETRILRDVSEAEALRGEWRDLVARAPRAELVLTPVWALAWWREFGERDGRRLELVTFRDGGKLVAVAPFSRRLAMHRRVLPVRRIELLMTGEAEEHEICSDYVGVLCDAGREDDVARALAHTVARERALGRWDEIRMPAMSSEDPLVPCLRAELEALGARVAVNETGRCPYIALPSSWDAYLKQLEGSSRYIVSRSLRELEKWAGKGGHALVRAGTEQEMAKGREILHSLHGERWSEEGERGVFASERFARFHDEVMPRLLAGEDGQLDLMWLTVKGEPVAAVYNIVFRNKVYFYQSGRKLEVPKQVKLGIAIHALAIKRSIELGHREYDFLNGASQYKMKLATATRPLVTLRAVGSSVRARAVEAARVLAEHAVERVRERRRAAAAVSGAPAAPAASGATGAAAEEQHGQD